MKKNKKLLFGGAAVLLAAAIAAILLTGFTGGETKATATQVRTSTLEKGDLAVSVSASGTVYSQKTTSVYSEINYPVKTVYVSVGDKVKEGDILADLDLSDLENDIEKQKASLSSQQKSAGLKYSTAQTNLNNYYRDYEAGYNSTLVNAESKLKSAQESLKNAELSIKTAEIDLESKADTLQTTREAYYDARSADADEDTVDPLRDKYEEARSAYDKSAISLDKDKAGYISAERALEEAEASYEAAKQSVKDEYASLQTQLQESALNTDFTTEQLDLTKLEAEMENSTIVAPVSGTITEVYAEPGVSGSGNGSSVMFIIQDTENLKVIANIMEYDVGSVEIGNRVVVTTDATGDAEIGGKLSKIAPTSTLTATGEESSSSTEAEYQSEITVAAEGARQGIRVGMNAQLSIVTKERSDVFTVLYDAVVKDRDKTLIYIMEPVQAAEGTPPSFTAKAIEVSTGLENDLYIEISGEGLQEGMTVISDATGITDGMAVEPRGLVQASGESGQGGGMGFGMPGMGGGGPR